jgi:lipopolysaccharide biosynthesis glycosyltransferase
MNPDIKLFITHSPNSSNYCINRPFTTNIIAGSEFLDKPVSTDFTLDNTGDNISSLNRSYSELTVAYWAWKNVSADYLGFCHYRRLFNFNPERLKREKSYGVYELENLSEEALDELSWNEQAIIDAIVGYDFIIAKGINITILGAKSVREQWSKTDVLPDSALDSLLYIIANEYPWLMNSAQSYFGGKVFYPCNMFVMSKIMIDTYFPILFDVLDKYESSVDMSTYSIQTLRTTGHLAERLFGIFYVYESSINRHRLKELDIVLFKSTAKTDDIIPVSENTVPIVFCANNSFTPYLDVCLSSFLDHVSAGVNYHFFVFHTDISKNNKARLSERFTQYPQANLTFVNVNSFFAGKQMKAKGLVHHVTIETFFRFLIPEVLGKFKKVLYLDSDLLALNDIAELFQTDLGDNLIGAIIDADYLSCLNYEKMTPGRRQSNGMTRYDYSVQVLDMADPYRYFQAGVLLINVEKMKKQFSFTEIIDAAFAYKYIYLDQDVLNKLCSGRVLFLDPKWNVLVDRISDDSRQDLIKKWAPSRIAESYEAARINPSIIHYAGDLKPWNNPDMDFAGLFWKYARSSPYYEELILRMTRPPKPTSFRRYLRTKKIVNFFYNIPFFRKIWNFLNRY